MAGRRQGWRRIVTPRVVAGLVATAVLALLFFLLLAPQPVPADFAEVRRSTLRITIDDEGYTRIRDVYVVSAPVRGQVLRLEGEAGDPVVAGETIIATIEPSDPAFLDRRTRLQAEANIRAAEAAVALAAANLRREEAELRFAEAEAERSRRLAERGTISASALDRAETEVEARRASVGTAEAELGVRRSELETARAQLVEPTGGAIRRSGQTGAVTEGPAESCCVEVRAPTDGRILRLFRESEGVVPEGTPLAEIGDPEWLEIVVDLLSMDAVRVTPGDPVVIDGWGGPPLAGRVRRVEPYGFTKISALGIEEQRVNVIIDLTAAVEEWRTLGHGYRVEAHIVISEGKDVLTLPVSALFRDGDAWAVFTVVDGRARRTSVEIARMNDEAAEIVRGLSAGDIVIRHASDRIQDGVPVIRREVGSS